MLCLSLSNLKHIIKVNIANSPYKNKNKSGKTGVYVLCICFLCCNPVVSDSGYLCFSSKLRQSYDLLTCTTAFGCIAGTLPALL